MNSGMLSDILLTCNLTCFWAFYLTCFLTRFSSHIYNIHRLPEIRCDVRSGMCSQELSDSLSKILADFFLLVYRVFLLAFYMSLNLAKQKLGIICVFASDGVFSGTLFGILSDMAFDILSDILLTCLMMLPWSDWQSIWLSILSEILSDMFFFHSTWHIFWRDIWHSTWYLGIYSYMFSACLFGILTGVFLAVYLRQILRAFLTFELTFDHRALCCLQWIQVSLKGTFRRIIPNMGIAKNH